MTCTKLDFIVVSVNIASLGFLNDCVQNVLKYDKFKKYLNIWFTTA